MLTLLPNALAKVMKLRPVLYDWRQDESEDRGFSEERQLGFVAQEIDAVVPEVVSEGSNGLLAVDYARVTPLLVAAMQTQQQTIEALQNDNAALRAELDELKKAVQHLMRQTGHNATDGSDPDDGAIR